MIKKGDSLTFYEQLKKLTEERKKEWVNQGNKEEDFERDGPKIVRILDNASFHKKKKIIEQIKENLPNIILEYLPNYRPISRSGEKSKKLFL